jgi:hypothetical protein
MIDAALHHPTTCALDFSRCKNWGEPAPARPIILY